MDNEKRLCGGYEIIESCTIGVRSLSSGITPKHQTPMCVGTVRAATIISGAITATNCQRHGKS